MNNDSGQGPASTVPAEIRGWNWGAFLLNWIWGVGNATYIAFLMFVPLVNMAMPFVLGAKGNEWAWRNKRWDSVEHFRRVQRQWAGWGLVGVAAFIAFFVGLFLLIMALMKNSEPYRLAESGLEQNGQAMAALGPPLSTGFITGNIETSGPSGHAEISYSVHGSKAKGTVYLKASKDMGQWHAEQLQLAVEGQPDRIDLLP